MTIDKRKLQKLSNIPSQRQVRRTFRSITGAIAGVIALVAAITAVAPSAQGAFPGANGKIAFVFDGDIFVMRSDGTNETRLTSDSADDFSPAFSPDGSRIVFSRYPGGIFVMNADGSGETQLTARGYYEQTPAFSADGSKIVWSGFDPATGRNEIFVMNADGSDPIQLTKHHSAHSNHPVFSPTGSKIAFIRNYSEAQGDFDYEIYVMDADGTNVTQVTVNESNDYSPDFSPDGSKIVFSLGVPWASEISVINADGTNEARLTDDSDFRSDHTPVFSPDGSKIAFTSFIRDPLISGNSRTGIFVMNADGSGVTQLRDDQACETNCGGQMSEDPAWQPLPLAPTTTTTSTTTTTTSTTTTMPATTTTTAPPTPMARIDCRNGGWRDRTTADGTRFSNQGQCMEYFSTGTLR